MPVQLFANNATTTLGANLGIGVLSMTVNTGDGALFPSPTGGDWFYATLESGANLEIVQVTARTGDVFTIVRAQEGTSDQSWSIGDTVELRITKAWLDRVHTLDSLPLASIGDVVGPASAGDSNVVMFDGTTGKLIKDSGLTLSGTNTGDQTLRIDSTLPFTDNTTGDVSTSKHGYTPKAPNDVTKFLNGLGAWSVPTASLGEELIVNGNMNIWQRGTSFTTIGLVHHADQWQHVEVSDGSVDVSRLDIGTDSTFHTASGVRLKYAMRYDVNTIDASIAAGEVVYVEQKIEGYRAQMYMHNQFTVSFYVRSNITGTFCFSVRNSVADKSFVKEFTIDSANTWERKTITVPTQDQTGTWDYTNGLGLDMSWCLMSGTTFGSATDNTWNSANYVATASQTNWMATATNNFDLTGVQVDLGPNAQPLRVAPIERDLVAAERYYQKSYDLTTDPGTSTVVGAPRVRSSSTVFDFPVIFRTKMRAAPTGAVYSTTGAAANVRDLTAGADRTASLNSLGESGMVVNAATSVSDGNVHAFQWTADATL